ncbi:uncharacterized protein LOC103702868 isoform X1 [Phoenix dactylifera]|uniref:RBR-type E3 ubiquitin transferase n=1 Tax=Phoenix dactylifera TaxID=42345 RepID=A0A8B7BR79_PHODC|nr:uncharacterized protein LOC103702868 isoform X1 [Phoenix dactylifera]
MDDTDELEILVSNQRRELMSARIAESDLDLAFRLQMEEAMAASLAVLPSHSSSSSSGPRPPPPPPPSGDEDDEISQVMALQALELERFHQERRDSEHCQAEFRRIAEDLRRRTHDERFAREIVHISDKEWEEWGDEFERPIEAVRNEEEPPFRLYFKGMTSRDSVRGRWLQLSAIAAAVCDPQDNLLLKIQKPMPTAGREVFEVKALIEGLSAALSLGIKRIDVFCDYRTLFNHITGRWFVRQNKVANIINQATLLQGKFERCQIFLLPRCHIKFVYRLARDVIDSQINKNVELGGNQNLKETCKICLEVTDPPQMFVVGGCLHCFCYSCMKQHVEVKLLHAMLPGCPHDGCNTRLDVESSRKFLSPKLLDIMVQRIKEASIPPRERIYCPYPMCSALMSTSEAIHPQQVASSKQFIDTSGLRKCIKCTGLFCINCKVPWHEKMSCFEYKRLNPNPPAEDSKLQSLAKQKLWRQCVKCNHMIELAEGCFHMTCRCGYEFCYTCGAEWKDKKATCSCPLWDEGYIWYDDSEDEDSEDFYDDDDNYDYDDEDDDYEDDYGHH